MPDFQFMGLDVVQRVVDGHRQRFAPKRNWRFGQADITRDALPPGYDLILCRDALMHLSLPLVVDALQVRAAPRSFACQFCAALLFVMCELFDFCAHWRCLCCTS